MWAYPSETCFWEVSQNISGANLLRKTGSSLCREDFDHDHFAQQAINLVEARAIEIPSVEGAWRVPWRCSGSINLLSQYLHVEYVHIVAQSLAEHFSASTFLWLIIGIPQGKHLQYHWRPLHYQPKGGAEEGGRVPQRHGFIQRFSVLWSPSGPSESQSCCWRGPSWRNAALEQGICPQTSLDLCEGTWQRSTTLIAHDSWLHLTFKK